MKKIFIVVPSFVTGGTEVCHQLADALNRNSERAFIIYFPLHQRHETPENYQRYNVRSVRLQDVEPGSIVVLPEILTSLIRRFPKAQVYFWWLSVDWFFDYAGRNRWAKVLGAERVAKMQLGVLRRRVTRHIYQSEYARLFLESVSLGPATRLSDCLADEYIQAIASPPGWPREDLLVYNPKKGMPRTELILQALNESSRRMPNVVPIRGMSPDQVRQLLGRAKVYIDFGGHPGKDRIPREAAALGACILVNRRGSAANSIDMPIPENFKIDDRISGFERLAVKKIHMLMDNFEREQTQFDSYRQSVAQEPATFLDDVDAIFPPDQ
jgi:hypothetical protein